MSQFDDSYYYEYVACPEDCNTYGISETDPSTFTGTGLSLSPFNWTFDANTWEAITGGLPVLPNAGATI